MTPVLTNLTRGGHSVFRIGRQYYVLNSRHLTKSAAVRSPAYADSFYFGKTKSKIAKRGRYWLVLQPIQIDKWALSRVSPVVKLRWWVKGG